MFPPLSLTAAHAPMKVSLCRDLVEICYGNSPQSVKQTYPKASIVGNNRVVFNIVGGNFRLVVKMAYRNGICFVRFIGTHKEYDKIDATKI